MYTDRVINPRLLPRLGRACLVVPCLVRSCLVMPRLGRAYTRLPCLVRACLGVPLFRRGFSGFFTPGPTWGAKLSRTILTDRGPLTCTRLPVLISSHRTGR